MDIGYMRKTENCILLNSFQKDIFITTSAILKQNGDNCKSKKWYVSVLLAKLSKTAKKNTDKYCRNGLRSHSGRNCKETQKHMTLSKQLKTVKMSETFQVEQTVKVGKKVPKRATYQL